LCGFQVCAYKKIEEHICTKTTMVLVIQIHSRSLSRSLALPPGFRRNTQAAVPQPSQSSPAGSDKITFHTNIEIHNRLSKM
jgi:hypothetical protein